MFNRLQRKQRKDYNKTKRKQGLKEARRAEKNSEKRRKDNNVFADKLRFL